MELEIVRHPGGSVIAAVNEQQKICVLRQYRHAAGGWIWELPAGKIDNNEPPLETAQRELLEEAGLKADSWQSMGEIFSTPGFCNEVLHLYLAINLDQLTAQPETFEFIEIHWLSLNDAYNHAIDGYFTDAKTIIGICRTHHQLSMT